MERNSAGIAHLRNRSSLTNALIALQQTQEIANLFTRYGEDLETLDRDKTYKYQVEFNCPPIIFRKFCLV